MRSLERVQNVIAGQPVDHLPAQPLVTAFAARHAGIGFIDYCKDWRRLSEAQLKVAEDFGIDCVVTASDHAREVIDVAGADCIDWDERRGPVINEDRAPLILPATLREFRVPDPYGGGRIHDRIKAIELMRKKVGQDLSVVGWIEGSLTLAASFRGLARLRNDIDRDPSFFGDLMDFAAEIAVRFADAQVRCGADTIGIGAVAAAEMGPQVYEKWVYPRQKRVLEAIKHRHPEVITRLHICGQTEPMLAKMSQLPVDIYELDSAVDLARARAWLGQGRVLAGNVSGRIELLEGSPRKVYDAARKCHKACGPYHIVSAGCDVPADIPADNLLALVRYAREHQPGSP